MSFVKSVESLSPSAFSTRSTRRPANRKGAVLVLSAFLMIFLLAVMAFSIDMGYKMNVQTEMQRAVDAAALAGAGVLVEGVDEAETRAVEYLARNPVGEKVVLDEDEIAEKIAKFLEEHGDDYEIKTGHWDAEAVDPVSGRLGVFTESSVRPSTISVSFTKGGLPFFFAPVLGSDNFEVTAEAIAMYQPREIMLVLDLSGSMSDDSRLSAIGTLEEQDVLDNLEQIYNELGAPSFGNLSGFQTVQRPSNHSNWSIKNYFGLHNVPYPYPSGSWDEYINYVQRDNGYYGPNIPSAYQDQFGGLTLVDYWLTVQPSSDQTPDLYLGSAQPITSVKDAVDVFFDYIQEVDTDDRVGLAVYNSDNGQGKLEMSLTDDFQAVENRTREFQAGHYHLYTNIGAGLKTAREHLESSSRPSSFKMIVLLTDGKANYYTGGYSTSAGKQYVLDQAQLAADAGFPVVTISLGAGADEDLMQDVADITNGDHFNVPGGQSVADYSEDLKEVFYDIANDRPLKIVR